MENETDSRINFLDITIQNKENKLLFNIYRKPTATDVIIPKDFCHPLEQKHAAIRHMINRMNTYRLNDDSKRTEHQIIEQIIINNGYETSFIKQFNKPRHKDNTNNTKDSWAKFTYFGRERQVITKLYKETQLRIAYKVNNTINKQPAPKLCNPKPQQQYEQSGVYSLHLPGLPHEMSARQAVHSKKRYKEYFHDYKYNIRKSSFATHLLDNNHSMGHINEIMKIIYTTEGGNFMVTVGRFHIYSETRAKNQINDKNTTKPNAIFDVINSHDPPRTPTV